MGKNNGSHQATEINPNARNRNQTQVNPNARNSDTNSARKRKVTQVNPNADTGFQRPMAFEYHLPVGTVVDGKYRIIDHMASGGAEAALHVCVDESSAQKLCLKLYADSSHVRQEVRAALMEIDHRNIARLIDWNEWGGRTYEVWQLYEGENLSQVIRQRKVSQRDIGHYLRQMDQALVELHRRKIVHQDIKPENFMITPDNAIILIDFGISSLGSDDGRTHITKIGKTTAYASPEVRMSDFCWPASDYYSLGVTLYEMIFGKTPYADYDEGMLFRLFDDMREVRISGLDKCDQPVRDLIFGLLQFEPSRRWGHDAVQAWLNGSYDAFMQNLNQSRSSARVMFTFDGKKYRIPDELAQLVTAMAFQWNAGVGLLDRDGCFVLLRDKVKNIEGMESVWAACNESRSDQDRNLAYFHKLYRIYPELKLFAWRGFVAEDPAALGKAILSALWQEEIQSETSGYASDPFATAFGDQPVELTYYWLQDMVEKHVIAYYLSQQKQSALYDRVLELENKILHASGLQKDKMVWYYKIGYLLSGSTELRFDGMMYEDLDDFLADVNEVISDCALSGNNGPFMELGKKICSGSTMHPGFEAWAESLGFGNALETLKMRLNRR
ncbi:MAG: serine/threonine protein kinase [Oscillospiraceae bacterium]|nr:serine/threonine protein kinase [Oscillospiraceae bacterium]